MEDPDYVPEWEEDCGWQEVEEERRPKKRQSRRSKSPEPEADFDWKAHYEEMKNMEQEPYQGIARPPLRIAAFNIQVFGERKIKKKNVSSILVKILQRYDLILIQEIRDSSDTALDGLVRMVTQVDPEDPYVSIVSERLGRTNSKEQYAFVFRTSRIAVRDTYQYDDGEDNGKDTFQREPFAVRFYSPFTTVSDFGIIAIHTQPDNAVKEIDGLLKVYEVTKKKWNLPDIMIAGDFNADEGYIDRDDWSKIALRNDRRFKWMIDDDTDTTVGNTDRAYDRFVIAGKNLTKGVVPGSSKVYKFDDALGLSPDEAEDVSDHYPIEIELAGSVNHCLQSQISTAISVTIKQKTPIANEDLVRKIYKTPSNVDASAHFHHYVTYDDNSMVCVRAVKRNVADVIATLREFQAAFPGVVFDDTLEMVKTYMDSSVMKHRPDVYGLVMKDVSGGGGGDGDGCGGGGGDANNVHADYFDVKIEAKIRDPLHCSIFISRPMS